MKTPKDLRFRGVRMSDQRDWRDFVNQSGLRYVSSLNMEAMVRRISEAVYVRGVANPLVAEWRRQGCGRGSIKPMVSPKKAVRSRQNIGQRSMGGFLRGIYSTTQGFLR